MPERKRLNAVNSNAGEYKIHIETVTLFPHTEVCWERNNTQNQTVFIRQHPQLPKLLQLNVSPTKSIEDDRHKRDLLKQKHLTGSMNAYPKHSSTTRGGPKALTSTWRVRHVMEIVPWKSESLHHEIPLSTHLSYNSSISRVIFRLQQASTMSRRWIIEMLIMNATYVASQQTPLF